MNMSEIYDAKPSSTCNAIAYSITILVLPFMIGMFLNLSVETVFYIFVGEIVFLGVAAILVGLLGNYFKNYIKKYGLEKGLKRIRTVRYVIYSIELIIVAKLIGIV